MKKRLRYISICTIFCGFFFSFQKGKLRFPDYFPKPVYDISEKPITTAQIQLGRKLFYDPILSADSSISCASCHSPYNAFAHSDHDLSHGIADQIGIRNAPPLFNLAWQPIFMWDGAINHIDVQALAPISHPKEMGESISHIVAKINANKDYRQAIKKAYGDTSITGSGVLKALAQFQLTLISVNSKYDSVQQHKATFTPQEQNGFNLFLKNCNSCHTAPLFTNFSFQNNGLIVDSTLNDLGRYAITQNTADSFLFKVPSLRNLSYTAPYMHDGRYKKLYDVLQHYTSIDINSAHLSTNLKNRIALTSNEKIDLIAFLLTLNDESFIKNRQFSFPQKK